MANPNPRNLRQNTVGTTQSCRKFAWSGDRNPRNLRQNAVVTTQSCRKFAGSGG